MQERGGGERLGIGVRQGGGDWGPAGGRGLGSGRGAGGQGPLPPSPPTGFAAGEMVLCNRELRPFCGNQTPADHLPPPRPPAQAKPWGSGLMCTRGTVRGCACDGAVCTWDGPGRTCGGGSRVRGCGAALPSQS